MANPNDFIPDDRVFRLLVEGIRDYAIFFVDRAGLITSWNAAAERLTGYSATEAVGTSLSTMYPDGDVVRDRLHVAGQHGSCEVEASQSRKDGTCFPARMTITAMRDDSGGLLGFGIALRDRTAERELREDAERFHDLAESVQEVFWVASATLQDVLYVSPAYERVWGRPLAFAYGSTAAWLTAVHPDDRAVVQEALERWAEGEYALDYRIVRPDGVVRWIHARGAAVRADNGTVERVVGIAEDITTRKEHEEELRYLAEASRILASSLDYEETLARVARLAVPEIADWCAVYIAEADELRIVEVAHRDAEKVAVAWEFRRRYPPDPAAPTGAYRVMHTGEPELIPEISPSLIEAYAPDEEFIRLIKELGLRSAMTVPMSARGRTLGVMSFIAAESGRRFGPQDLEFAETLAARAALAIDNARLYRAVNEARGEAERRAREEAALREAAAAVSASFTVNDVIRQISGSAVTATNSDGAYVQQIRGDVVEVVAVSGAIAPRVGSKLPYEGSYVQRVVETQEPEVIRRLADSPRPLPDGLAERYPDCSALVVPLVDAGEPIGALFLVRLPERWYFRVDEVERALTFGDLAALAFRKVHILEESERRREELEQVTESRARLMRGFSHDLKNPLGAADGLLQLIEDGILEPGTPRAHDAIGRARRALRSSFRLIDDLLELARAEAGEVEIRLRSTDVREAARELVEEYRAQAEAEGLQVEVQLPKEMPLIASDVARVRQILGNLLSNAVKYTPAGGTITVRVDERERPDQPGRAWVTVEVRDTGPGIPQEQQHYIFREFTRLERGGDKSGAGIGLAISKRLALALGGDLTLESEPGKGATFTLWLPRQREDMAARKSA